MRVCVSAAAAGVAGRTGRANGPDCRRGAAARAGPLLPARMGMLPERASARPDRKRQVLVPVRPVARASVLRECGAHPPARAGSCNVQWATG